MRGVRALGHRLSKIYTRTGDEGTTGLADGSRVAKDDARVHAMGDVDELNTQIGAVRLHAVGDQVDELLADIQHALFDIGGELAIPGAHTLSAADVVSMEKALDALNAELKPLKEFILPAGDAAVVAAHVARAVCRRAERRFVTVARDQDINPHSQKYLNRLSDLMFVLARALAKDGTGEVYWDPKRARR